MKETNHLENLQEIRSIMEKSTRFLSLSGMSGISAGVVAIIGAIAAHFRIADFLRMDEAGISEYLTLERDLLFIAAIVLASALCVAYFFTARKAKKNREVIWNKAAKRLMVNLAIPLCAGGVVGLILIKDGFYGYVAPITLVFYGLACINASHQTVRDIFFLGVTNVILGLFGMFFIGQGLLFWTLGFGFAHILYGTLMYFKYDRKS